MKPLPYEESEQIFQDTGLDIDGRRKLIQDFIPSYDKCVQNYMAFVETLPGFTVLPLKDKVSLIKGMVHSQGHIRDHVGCMCIYLCNEFNKNNGCNLLNDKLLVSNFLSIIFYVLIDVEGGFMNLSDIIMPGLCFRQHIPM